jgi:hypothetical protein
VQPDLNPEMLTAATVRKHAEDFLFRKPLVVNVFRSVLAEAMIDLALGDDWAWVAADYAAFDFKHLDGTRLEVKQASNHQSWESASAAKSRFDVAKRGGLYEGNVWTQHAGPARNTDLYVFGYHGVEDRSLADHRRPDQWHFAVVDAARLRDEKSLSHKRVSEMSDWYAIGELAAAVEKLRLNRSR